MVVHQQKFTIANFNFIIKLVSQEIMTEIEADL